MLEHKQFGQLGVRPLSNAVLGAGLRRHPDSPAFVLMVLIRTARRPSTALPALGAVDVLLDLDLRAASTGVDDG